MYKGAGPVILVKMKSLPFVSQEDIVKQLKIASLGSAQGSVVA
jgi:hypothetical protein